MRGRRTDQAGRGADAVRSMAGVTLPELIVGLSVAAIGVAVSMGSYFNYQESVAAGRAARVISSDVQLARSLAIRARGPVSLVANEAQRQYVLRDTAGTLFHRRDFGAGSELPLTALDVVTAGDSLTFDGRGILITTGPAEIQAVRRSKTRTVTLNALGRSVVN